jgi:hypothetical protein
MSARWLLIAAAAVLTLSACEQSQTELAEERARKRLEAEEKLLAARVKADAAVARATQETAKAEVLIEQAMTAFEAARADAMRRYEAAEIQCDPLQGVDKIACLSTADAELARDEAAAISSRDEALVRADLVE